MSKKTTRRSLLSSVFALVLCVAMLVGATFAWFTDTATTGVNKIVSGKLDVALEMKNSEDKWVNAEGKTLDFVKAEGAENEKILWEPGCTYKLPDLRIVNNGNLALKYKVLITGIQGDAKLNKAITWTIGAAAAGAEQHLAAGAYNEFIIKGHMQETAGNEYQNLSIDGISITVYATKDTVESDSFGNDYDKNATYSPTLVGSNEDAENELSKNEENIYVALSGNVSFDVAPYAQKPMGGSATKTIVIDGNGYKLTFNNTNSDWNNVTWGDAKLIIRNAVIDNSGYNADGGTWNSHDINFKGDLELENVTFMNAVALEGKASLKNVHIEDKNAVGDTYMLWIRSGSEVYAENLSIDGNSANGHANCAIAIKDQYLTDPGATTLTLNGATITTDKYAAVYVTSSSDTTVNLQGTIDVSGAAVNDKVVQIDSGNVTVNDNSTKVVKAGSQEDLKSAINASASGPLTVKVDKGTYTLYNVANDKTQNTTLTIEGSGAEDTNFTIGNLSGNLDGEYNADYSYENSDVTFKNMTVNVGQGNYKGIVRAKDLHFENCTIVGRPSYMGTGKVTFKDCVFESNAGDYNMWIYSGMDFTFDGCTFKSDDGKFINAYKEKHTDITKLAFVNCQFIAGRENKPAVCIKGFMNLAWDVSFSGCTLTNCKTDATTGSDYYLFDQGIESATKVTIDNTVVWENGAKK